MKEQVQCLEISQSEEGILRTRQPPERDAERPFFAPAVTVGRLAALRSGSAPLVDYPNNDSGALIPARSLVSLNETQIGSELALAFEDGDGGRPIILGVIQSCEAHSPDPSVDSSLPADVAGERDTLHLTAAKEITLRCGKASITLTNAGKLILRGAYLLSRSSGVNRIKGGSVQIN